MENGSRRLIWKFEQFSPHENVRLLMRVPHEGQRGQLSVVLDPFTFLINRLVWTSFVPFMSYRNAWPTSVTGRLCSSSGQRNNPKRRLMILFYCFCYFEWNKAGISKCEPHNLHTQNLCCDTVQYCRRCVKRASSANVWQSLKGSKMV